MEVVTETLPKRVHVLDLLQEEVLPKLKEQPKEAEWLRKLIAHMMDQGQAVLEKAPPRFKREFNPASSRQRTEHHAKEFVRMAERQGQPAIAFFQRPDAEGVTPVGISHADDEFTYGAVMSVLMNNHRIGLAVLRKMISDERIAEVLKQVAKEEPELAAEVLASGKRMGLERADLELSDLPKYQEGQHVRLLAPDDDAEGSFADTMREFADKLGQVKKCTSDYVLVEVQRKTGQTPDSMGVLQDAYEFLELMYPIDKVIRDDQPATGEPSPEPVEAPLHGAGGHAGPGEGDGAPAHGGVDTAD